MPTKNSEAVLRGTLKNLAEAAEYAGINIGTLIVVDGESEDKTCEIVQDFVQDTEWTLDLVCRPSTLPEAREIAINRVESEWFLFLDDDVRLNQDYLENLTSASAPLIGGIQGRRDIHKEHPSDWVRFRSHRAGTHATLIQHKTVHNVSFPSDLLILEDEYLRRHIEKKGYLWVFNHQAEYTHRNQWRHPIGWQEGYLGGKYGLSQFHHLLLSVLHAIINCNDPVPGAKRAAGWIAGWATRFLRT
jgi:glycosyltransferase involved in cell wall biosynthesis